MFSSQPVVVQWALEVGASLPPTWAVFSDTDRFNRASGMGMSYQTRLDPEGGPQHTGSLRKLGMTHTWDELPFLASRPPIGSAASGASMAARPPAWWWI